MAARAIDGTILKTHLVTFTSFWCRWGAFGFPLPTLASCRGPLGNLGLPLGCIGPPTAPRTPTRSFLSFYLKSKINSQQMRRSKCLRTDLGHQTSFPSPTDPPDPHNRSGTGMMCGWTKSLSNNNCICTYTYIHIHTCTQSMLFPPSSHTIECQKYHSMRHTPKQTTKIIQKETSTSYQKRSRREGGHERVKQAEAVVKAFVTSDVAFVLFSTRMPASCASPLCHNKRIINRTTTRWAYVRWFGMHQFICYAELDADRLVTRQSCSQSMNTHDLRWGWHALATSC